MGGQIHSGFFLSISVQLIVKHPSYIFPWIDLFNNSWVRFNKFAVAAFRTRIKRRTGQTLYGHLEVCTQHVSYLKASIFYQTYLFLVFELSFDIDEV